jgi:hypothetical protein
METKELFTLMKQGSEHLVHFKKQIPQTLRVIVEYENCTEDNLDVQFSQVYRLGTEFENIENNTEEGLRGMNGDDLLTAIKVRACNCKDNPPKDGWRIHVTAYLKFSDE